MCEKHFCNEEKLSLKKVNFDYKNEAIEDFICLDNYICILSINKKVFLYNESGLYKIQINDSFNTIYQMKNCIFLLDFGVYDNSIWPYAIFLV